MTLKNYIKYFHYQQFKSASPDGNAGRIEENNMNKLHNEVKQTLIFLIEMDLRIYGKISVGTQEAITAQGYKLNENKIA